MASVRNRRNPEVLLDLIAGHALVCRFRRAAERLEDGGIAVTATEDDFRYAARLFADLHTTGGSLEAKSAGRHPVLSLATRNRVAQFTLLDPERGPRTYEKCEVAVGQAAAASSIPVSRRGAASRCSTAPPATRMRA